jgi:hypothetical protein
VVKVHISVVAIPVHLLVCAVLFAYPENHFQTGQKRLELAVSEDPFGYLLAAERSRYDPGRG